MTLKTELIKLTLMFLIQIVILLFVFLLYFENKILSSVILFVCMFGIFILMIIKGRRLKMEYPEEYE